jgi:hypothetical protein
MTLKIFGIGLAKTGTASLAQALRELGLRARHDYRLTLRMTAELLAGRRPDVGSADAFLDWPRAVEALPLLAAAFPDARFVVTDREVEGWIDSRLVHVLHSRVTGSGPWLDADTGGWRREREELMAAAGGLEPGRLLVFDVREGWGPLCRFLGLPVPAVASFPRENGGHQRLVEILGTWEQRARG